MDLDEYRSLTLEERTGFALGRLAIVAAGPNARLYRPRADGTSEGWDDDAPLVSEADAKASAQEASEA